MKGGYYMSNYYELPTLDIWQGRVDSIDDYESFRWHQYIQPLDLSKDIPKLQSGIGFVIIGYKVDEGIILNKGQGGAAKGPDEVRKQLCNKPCSFTKDVKIYDGGNVLFTTSVEQAQIDLSNCVSKILENGYFPIIIGGGHDVTFGHMQGLYKHEDINLNKLGFINFDAHFDNRPGDFSTSGTIFRQIESKVSNQTNDFHHLTIGIQKSSNTVALFKHAKEVGSQYILARDVYSAKEDINKYKIDQFLKEIDHVLLTVCTDVFASSFAPGVSAPQPMGIVPQSFMSLFRYIISSGKVVSFDIAEISPDLDNGTTTSSLGSTIVYNLVSSLALYHGYDLLSEYI